MSAVIASFCSTIRSTIRSTYFAVLLLSLIPFVSRNAYFLVTSILHPASALLSHLHLDSSSGTMSNMTPSQNVSQRMPVYFMGIGGPNFMENTEHPAYDKLAEIGKEITTKVKPKAIVVFSAHWQSETSKIQINAAEETDLIYDFYGFPSHYYEYNYPNRGSREVAEKVIEKLALDGIEVERVKRGLDHGVWAGFMVGRSILTTFASVALRLT
jgi:4,5-DOPA dioxygenase extradiol